MEELDYSVLFRWFVGLWMDDPAWDPTTFTKNRDRLLASDIADAFFQEVVAAASGAGLLSDEHFTVDGSCWKRGRVRRVSADATRRRTRPTILAIRQSNFRGEQRKNDTHQSTTDADARLCKKSMGSEAKLA